MTAPLLIVVVAVLAGLGSVLVLARRVPAGHAGVRLRMGEVHETLTPGRHLRLPGDRLVVVPLAEQDARVRRQPVPAGDGRDVMVEATVRYRVVDAYRLVRESGGAADAGPAIESVLLTVVRCHLMSRTAADAVADPASLTAELPEGLGRGLVGLGLEVESYDVRLDLPV